MSCLVESISNIIHFTTTLQNPPHFIFYYLFSNMNLKFLSALLLVANGALAQTPPGFSPSTKNTLGVKYGNINASKGDLVPISGQFTKLYTLQRSR